MSNPKFCQICRGPWPDGHESWCPVLTGEAQEAFIPLKPITVGDLEAAIRRLRMERKGDNDFTVVLDAAERELERIRKELREDYYRSFGL